MVLVSAEDPGEFKVLLTNTVYPLSKAEARESKPRYRLRGKRSAPFAVRVVAATDVSFLRGEASRFAPGGESLEFSVVDASDESDHGFSFCGRDPGEEDSALTLVEVGSGFGACWEAVGPPEMELDSQEPGDFLEAKVFSGLLEGANLGWIQDRIDQQAFSDLDCLEVLEKGLEVLPVTRRPLGRRNGRAVLLGLYGVGGFHGVTRATGSYSEVVRYLNGFFKTQCPEQVWTTFYVTKNAALPIHRDLRNAEGSCVCVRALGDFTGGGLWVEDEHNCGPVGKVLPSGVRRFGKVFDVKGGPVVFSGKRWHVAEEWEGTACWVISAFVPRDIAATTEGQWSELHELGFPIKEARAWLSHPSEHRIIAGPEEVNQLLRYAEWDIGLPLPVVDEEVWVGFERCHDAESRRCRLLVGDLDVAWESTGSGVDIACQLRDSEQKCAWLEDCLSRSQPEEVAVRALQREIPLAADEVHVDQFLQTRTVGLPEARKELEKWKDPALEEISSLEDVNRAVDRVSVADVDKWAAEGINIVQLPGKVVLTRKSGTGKRRCRAVCCGNYLPTDKLGLSREDLYASGAESLSVKVALIFAAGFSSWTGVTIDVKSAFLYAPIRSDVKGSEERIIVKPPNFLLELGIMTKEDRWWVRKALYGLPTSPRDWGRYRDAEFAKFCLQWGNDEYKLVQTMSDDALWVARKITKTGYGDIAGLLVVYVDDLLFLGPRGLGEAFVAAVQERWKTSMPEWFSETSLTFCGMELSRHTNGYRMCQTAYVRELLGRYGVEEFASTPITRWTEPEVGPPPEAEAVKEAQAMTGALLWLSTRTRPDLAYVVSRCGQQATKCPSVSVSLGKQALAYLRSTLDFGIDVPFAIGSTFSDHGLLALPRTERVLELYTDASHSPCGGRSIQGIFLLWRGVPVMWESSRQSFVTLSSAEAELVTMIAGVQVAEAVQPLISELIEQDTTVSLLADNEAAIRAFDAAPAGWRSRHLRMRAYAARERISANLLRVTHLPGEFQIADIATKPLARARILQLLELANIRGQLAVAESVQNARMLSRLSLGVASNAGEVAQTLAGLTLLALLPRARGQPAEDQLELSWNWLVWTLGILVVGVSSLWGWWCFSCWSGTVLAGGFEGLAGVLGSDLEEEVGSGAQDSSSEGVVSAGASPAEQGTNVETVSCLPGDQRAGVNMGSGFEADSEDESSRHREWLQAQAGFERQERYTGLTFVQRCRLRRALARGEVLDPPVFQQRFGPPPEWLEMLWGQESDEVNRSLSEDDFGEGGTVFRQGNFDWLRLLDLQGGLLLGFLGNRSAEWSYLRRTARGFYHHAFMIFAARPGTREWLRLLDLQGGLLLGFLGIRSEEWGCFRRTARAVYHHALMILAARFQDTGVPHTLPVGMAGRVEFHFVAIDGGYRWVPGEFLVGSSSEEVSTGIGLQIGGSSEEVSTGAGLQIEGSSEEVSTGAGLQIEGSSEEVSTAGLQVGGSTGPWPDVQVGGSASSTDPCPFEPSQQGQSPSSHGFGHHQDSWGLTYEDLTGADADFGRFPIVGSWFGMHFLGQVFSVSGVVVLEWLGTRVPEWLSLRSVSSVIRYTFEAAVAEDLRRGPYWVMFSGPQWQIAVEEYILTGYPLSEAGAGNEPEEEPLVVGGEFSNFPYIEWPPSVWVHFLWRVFAMCGSRILACLGDRTREWGYLYASARGFRSHVVYALICWLRSTGIQRVADGPITYDAAQAYLRSGIRAYPFDEASDEEDLEIDERPHRGRFPGGHELRLRPVVDALLEASSSEESSGSSTAEPSETFAELSDANGEEGPSVDASSPGLVYVAGEGVLFCLYGDDWVQVPLQGWSTSDVGAIVQGLNTGDWSELQRVLSEGSQETAPEQLVQPVLSEDELDVGIGSSGLNFVGSCFGGGWGRWRRFWFFVFVLWLEAQTVRALGMNPDESPVAYCYEGRDLSIRQAWSFGQDVVMPEEDGYGCDGSFLWELVKAGLVVLTWEISRRVWNACVASRKVLVDAGSQTCRSNFVPLPLGPIVRCRARILLCLWRAGFKIDATDYPERIQSEFHALIGGYLLRVEAGGVSSSDSD